jgi:DNA-binding MarR family transcriptional regulator
LRVALEEDRARDPVTGGRGDGGTPVVDELVHERDWGGLRISHIRVLSHVPPEGISITDLAQRVGMTKQGCGQFVTQLVHTGHLEVTSDVTDRRVRVAQRTGAGDDVVATAQRRIEEIERAWAAQVGERRYATFRAVLRELRSAR